MRVKVLTTRDECSIIRFWHGPIPNTRWCMREEGISNLPQRQEKKKERQRERDCVSHLFYPSLNLLSGLLFSFSLFCHRIEYPKITVPASSEARDRQSCLFCQCSAAKYICSHEEKRTWMNGTLLPGELSRFAHALKDKKRYGDIMGSWLRHHLTGASNMCFFSQHIFCVSKNHNGSTLR